MGGAYSNGMQQWPAYQQQPQQPNQQTPPNQQLHRFFQQPQQQNLPGGWR